MKLIRQITEEFDQDAPPLEDAATPDDAAPAEDEGAKRKFIAIVRDESGAEVEKKCKAFSVADIKAFYGEKFVSADLHPDEMQASGAAPDEEGAVDEVEPEIEAEPDEELEKPAPVKEAVLGSRVEYTNYESWKRDLPKNSTHRKTRDQDDAQAVGKDFEGRAGLWNFDENKGWIYRYYLTKSNLLEGRIIEMAKRTTPAEFYKLCVAKHGIKNSSFMSWAMIKAVADENDILIPAYIRDNKRGRGIWDAKPKDMKAPAHEPTIASDVAARQKSVDAWGALTKAKDAAKDEPKPEPKAEPKPAPKKDTEPKGAPVPEKKEYHEKHEFDVEFAWTTTYSDPRDLYAAIKQHHGVEHTDTQRLQVGKSSTGRFGIVLATYYIVKKGTMDVLGRWTVTGGDKIPGRGMVAYGEGNIAMSKKAIKNRDENMYGFLIKPQHGSPYVSVGTQHSHGPWDKFSAEANVRDKYEHFEYDDEFGHGTIQVVKVVKKNGKWERA